LEVALLRMYVLAFLLLWLAASARADVAKASAWFDLVVVTQDGELLGRVEDFAIERDDLSLLFVVVSVGSFLIDDNLIAVAPDALEMSADGEFLVVHTTDLANARRFGPNTWPDSADVLASARAQLPTDVEVPSGSGQSRGFDEDGIATISDGRRTAVIRSGEQSVSVSHEEESEPAAIELSLPSSDTLESIVSGEADPTQLVLPDFGALDGNGDGQLDRREIGARLGRTESFTELDIDESGSIDTFEFDLLVESRQ